MKKQLLTLLTTSLLFLLFTACSDRKNKTSTYDRNITTLINIYGKTDKRLHLDFYVAYRPKYFEDDVLSPECETALNPVTATKRAKLKYSGMSIENQDEYNITLAIHNKDIVSRCKYEPVGISLHVSRIHEKNGLYSVIPVLSDTAHYAAQSRSGSSSGRGWGADISYRHEIKKIIGHVQEPPKYFRIKNGTVAGCYTRKHKAHHVYATKTEEHVNFICDLPPYIEINSWQDEIVDDSIHLDIVVDEEKCKFLHMQSKRKVIGGKEPFQEKKLNWYDKIKLWIKGESK